MYGSRDQKDCVTNLHRLSKNISRISLRRIVFAKWLTGEKRLALFPAGTLPEIPAITNLRQTAIKI